MLLSEFQDPGHFLWTYLEAYQADPTAATLAVTMSLFDDLPETCLVRADIIDKSLDTDSAKIVQAILHNYQDNFDMVQTFNKTPEQFDLEAYITRMKKHWES